MTDRPARHSKGSENPANRGIGYDALDEKVPAFAPRTGDLVITGDKINDIKTGGVNNNAWIVLGRDRVGDAVSGYGGKGIHGAGAIDIVVGRSAPFPVCAFKGSTFEVVQQDPVFTTKRIDKLSHETLGNGEKHPGLVMDAARIYISQTCDIDHAFGLNPGANNPSPKAMVSPRSAIGMKADEIRIISRQGLKLVTGAGEAETEKHNSQGGSIGATYGIELMAGNGKPGPQQPLVKGKDLKEALQELVELIDQVCGIVISFIQIQMIYNIDVGVHWHPEIVLLGFPGIFSPVLALQSLPIMISEILSKLVISVVNCKANMGSFENNYLSLYGSNYINSRYNTTN